jgi:hypothetical protein
MKGKDLHPSSFHGHERMTLMNSKLTIEQTFTADEQRHLAAELTGCSAEQLIKVRATPDSLVVVIHTGQKFSYDPAAIQGAIERLAAGAGRFARETFLAELDQDAQAILAAPVPAPTRRASRGRRAGGGQ